MVLFELINKKALKYKSLLKEVFYVRSGEIKAVHYDDLVEFLKSLEEYERVVSGEVNCFFCGGTITLDNIQSVFPLNGTVQYCCNNQLCYSNLIEGGNAGA